MSQLAKTILWDLNYDINRAIAYCHTIAEARGEHAHDYANAALYLEQHKKIMTACGSNHQLIEVYRGKPNQESHDGTAVVRWCENCGALVIDLDYPNRIKPGYLRELQLPTQASKSDD